MRRIVAGQKQVDKDSMGLTSALALALFLSPAICHAGILDPWQWARSDRLEVNIPWLPCEYSKKKGSSIDVIISS